MDNIDASAFAEKLIKQFEPFSAIDITGKPSRLPFAKQCALVAVDLMIQENEELFESRVIFLENVKEKIKSYATGNM